MARRLLSHVLGDETATRACLTTLACPTRRPLSHALLTGWAGHGGETPPSHALPGLGWVACFTGPGLRLGAAGGLGPRSMTNSGKPYAHSRRLAHSRSPALTRPLSPYAHSRRVARPLSQAWRAFGWDSSSDTMVGAARSTCASLLNNRAGQEKARGWTVRVCHCSGPGTRPR